LLIFSRRHGRNIKATSVRPAPFAKDFQSPTGLPTEGNNGDNKRTIIFRGGSSREQESTVSLTVTVIVAFGDTQTAIPTVLLVVLYVKR
jgi:hypothetical protein